MMDYELFKATVVKELPNYLSPEYRDVELRTRSMTKVNQTKDSLEFYQPDDKGKGGIAPTFYLDDLYEHYKECEDIRQVLHDTAGRYESAVMSMPNFHIEELNADFIRKNVIMTLVNTESNRDLLEKMPHREINDCSVMYRVVFTVEGEGISSAMLDNNLMESYDLTEEELFDLATENTKRILPPKITSMKEMMKSFMISSGLPDGMDPDFLDAIMPEQPDMYVLSNEYGVQGAVNMIFDDNLQQLSEMVNDDLYVMPSSIHEVICIGAAGNSPEQIADIVRECNMTVVQLSERLSNQVFHYDREERKLTMVTDSENRRIDGLVAEPETTYIVKNPVR